MSSQWPGLLNKRSGRAHHTDATPLPIAPRAQRAICDKAVWHLSGLAMAQTVAASSVESFGVAPYIICEDGLPLSGIFAGTTRAL